MKANIICNVCGMVLGQIEKPVITNYDIEKNRGTFFCDCGGEANLVIQPEE